MATETVPAEVGQDKWAALRDDIVDLIADRARLAITSEVVSAGAAAFASAAIIVAMLPDGHRQAVVRQAVRIFGDMVEKRREAIMAEVLANHVGGRQ